LSGLRVAARAGDERRRKIAPNQPWAKRAMAFNRHEIRIRKNHALTRRNPGYPPPLFRVNARAGQFYGSSGGLRLAAFSPGRAGKFERLEPPNFVAVPVCLAAIEIFAPGDSMTEGWA